MSRGNEIAGILAEVCNERIRQDQKWGEQNHPPEWWLAILGEEYGEACKGALEAHFDLSYPDAKMEAYRDELIQVAAVAVAAIESLDRALRRGKNGLFPKELNTNYSDKP